MKKVERNYPYFGKKKERERRIKEGKKEGRTSVYLDGRNGGRNEGC